MKNKNYLILLTALALVACEDDSKMSTPRPSELPEEDAGEPAVVDPEDDADVAPEEDADVDGEPDPMGGGMMGGGDPDAGGEPEPEPDGGQPQAAWYTCQNTDQQFVRNAMLAVLGRRPYSQAEVNLYTDLIAQIDELDGVTTRTQEPGAKLRRSRKVMLQALFKDPAYAKHWDELYRDFVRIQRVDEMLIAPCMADPLTSDPAAVAAHVRSKPVTAQMATPFNLSDVIKGSLSLDDVSPIYTAHLWTMLTETYAGANAEELALELGRRRDIGAWFDAVYLNRDTVCLNCHNTEFSVTQTNNPATNRHFPLPYNLEKTLFGDSTGPETFGGYEGADRMHAPLKYKNFVNDCNPTNRNATDTCLPDEQVYRCLNSVRICDSVYQKRLFRPWGWLDRCGKYTEQQYVGVDLAGVEAKFGNVNGLRASMYGLSESLRTGFLKLKKEGLGADMNGDVADPDKAFAYLTTMVIVEKVWQQIVGTPLTIPTRYPRNAAARDQLSHLVNTFVASGFSNQKLIEAILASPYANMAAPNDGCGDSAYAAPAIFDPWVTAETTPEMRKNSIGDSIVSLTARTAANAAYAALKWTPGNPYPGNANQAERVFQNETGFFLKNAEPGFRGFDFQARLGWENRFGACVKTAVTTAPDFIDELTASVNAAGVATVGDLVLALKDRMLGRPSFSDLEKPALEALLGADLSADASTLTDANASLRQVCGVFASTPQFMLLGLPTPDATEVPKLTPPSASFATLCTTLKTSLTGDVRIECNDDNTLSLLPR